MTVTERVQNLLKRSEIRYLIAGGTSEAIEYFSFIALYVVSKQLYVSNTISFALGVFSGFLIHKFWTFPGEHQFKTRQQFAGYVGLALLNFFIITAIVGFMVDGLHVPAYIAKFVAIAVAAVWSFFFANKVFFRRRSPKPDTHPEQK